MKKSLSVLAFVVLSAAMMYGQASRTWVSGVGDDANPCSRTAPCKTFAGAISKTAAGGEIDALDPGGFGAVTITKAITFDGGGGQVASILVAGTNGIVVQAGASDVVIIRNIRINGISSGFNGIRWLSGKALHVENCSIFGFTANGIDIEKSDGGHAFVSGTVVANNANAGILAKNATNNVTVTVTNSIASDNQFGILDQDFSIVTVFGSEITGNTNAGLKSSPTGGTFSTLLAYNSSVSNNTIGLQSDPGATVGISAVAFFDNAVGMTGTAPINSAHNNFNNTTGAPNGNLTVQ